MTCSFWRPGAATGNILCYFTYLQQDRCSTIHRCHRAAAGAQIVLLAD